MKKITLVVILLLSACVSSFATPAEEEALAVYRVYIDQYHEGLRGRIAGEMPMPPDVPQGAFGSPLFELYNQAMDAYTMEYLRYVEEISAH